MDKDPWMVADFSLSQTLECGQCFRYEKEQDHIYTVISGQRVATLGQTGDSIVFYRGQDRDFWTGYFDLERDYGAIKERLRAEDPIMAEAISFAPGIHLMQQEFFEMLLSFIISQNNHIPRIRGLILRLSEAYGAPLEGGQFAFPTAEALAEVGEADFRALGCGFRARYLADAVDKVLKGGYSREELLLLDTENLRRKLMEICGIGQKVADCIMLFALGRYEVFPADVWIQRVYSYAYHQGRALSLSELQKEAQIRFGGDAGFAQQYLFHYGRAKKIGKG